MRMLLKIIAIMLLVAGIGVSAVASRRHVPTRSEPGRPNRSKFVKQTFSPRAVVRAGANAAIGQARNSPREWGQGGAGYGKRFGSAFAGHVVKNSIQYPVAYFRHEYLGYQPSGKHGFTPRLGHALESTVI